MKKKELNRLAQQIAEAEQTIMENKDKESVLKAKLKIASIAEQVIDLKDLMMLDDLIQEKLKNS